MIKLEVDAAEFAQAVDRVSTVSSEEDDIQSIEENLLTLAIDAARARATLDGQQAHINVIEIGFNSKYLLDITSQLISDTTKFFFSESGAPSLIRDPADEATLYVLMPMRV